jgi:hypothetical protein
MPDQSTPEPAEEIRRSVEELRRELAACREALAATRAWCIGLEEEQVRLWAALRGASQRYRSRSSSCLRTSSR